MSTTWLDGALCAQIDGDTMFPDVSAHEAKSICGRCDVKAACLEDALTVEAGNGWRWGIRGGKSPRQRYRLERERAAS